MRAVLATGQNYHACACAVLGKTALKTPNISPKFRGQIRTFTGKNLGVFLGVLGAVSGVPVQSRASQVSEGTPRRQAYIHIVGHLARYALGVFTSKTPKTYPCGRVEFYSIESTYIYIYGIVSIFSELYPTTGVVIGGF